MRHPSQAALVPPAQAEALYDIALEEEFNNEPEEVYPAERISPMSGSRNVFSTIGQVSEVAMPGQAPRTVLSENLVLPPNVRQTNR
jgi:hypothetical protein